MAKKVKESAETVVYNGNVFPKAGFRTWVYGPDDQQKLANSWQEYQDLVCSGAWFPTKELVHEKVKTKGQAK